MCVCVCVWRFCDCEQHSQTQTPSWYPTDIWQYPPQQENLYSFFRSLYCELTKQKKRVDIEMGTFLFLISE